MMHCLRDWPFFSIVKCHSIILRVQIYDQSGVYFPSFVERIYNNWHTTRPNTVHLKDCHFWSLIASVMFCEEPWQPGQMFDNCGISKKRKWLYAHCGRLWAVWEPENTICQIILIMIMNHGITRPSILCVTQKRAFMPLYIVLGQQRACMPVYIGKSGDLVGCYRCLTDIRI